MDTLPAADTDAAVEPRSRLPATDLRRRCRLAPDVHLRLALAPMRADRSRSHET